MAIEAIFQKAKALGRLPDAVSVNQVSYKLRNITFFRALPIDEESGNTKIMLALNPCASTKDSWHEFKISSVLKDIINDHCQGLVSLSEEGIQGMLCVAGLKITADISSGTRERPSASSPRYSRLDVVQGNARCGIQLWSQFPTAAANRVNCWSALEPSHCLFAGTTIQNTAVIVSNASREH